jgi:hypothetical protein
MPIPAAVTLRRCALLPLLLGLVATCVLVGATNAAAATCPSPNTVVQENACAGAGSTGWRLTNYEPNSVAGFATKPSVNVGSPVTLDIGGFDSSDSRVDISVYRIGYYGGTGGRLVHTATNVAVNNGYGCGAPDSVTGIVSCDNWFM